MIRRTQALISRVCIAALLAGVVAVHVSAPAPAGARGAGRMDGIPPSLDSMPRHPWPRDTSWRDTVGRDTVWRDTLHRDSLPDSSRPRPPKKPHRPLR